ncbi:AraC family transcriptional regulator [Nocardia wallacei]|uniref:AraC family transcriptional regulator n=1 Tax=Nocardia wallacei TaxID=480035 RepID=UPI002458F3E1|nr:helix-turn-helix transcriptional regulator [Nocardia wallacei]
MRYHRLGFSTTDDVPVRERPELWVDHVRGNHGGGIDFRFRDTGDFHGMTNVHRLSDYRLGDYQAIEFESGAIEYYRRADAADKDHDRSARLVIPQEGRIRLAQAGDRAVLTPGRMGLVHWGREMTLAHDAGARARILTIPSNALPAPIRNRPPLLLDSRNAVLGSVRDLATNLTREHEALSARQFVALYAALVDLLASAVDELRAPGADRMARVVADACLHIDMYSDDPRLSVKTLADRLGKTRRQLEFAMVTVRRTTPAALLRETRLRRARARLEDPTNTRTVGEIASESGFNSLSTFNEAFVREFGEHPGEVKSRARSSAPCKSVHESVRIR